MNTTLIGRKAEAAAANYLDMRGFAIIEQNFRRPRLEIDIVAKKHDRLYFVEVKYRADDAQGGGLEAITATKLRQMQYAADAYVHEVKWAGEYQVAAIELAGADFSVVSFVDDIL